MNYDDSMEAGKNDTLLARIAQLEREVSEQARLNGMGSEREAALLSKVADLERELAEAKAERESEAHDANETKFAWLQAATDISVQLDAATRRAEEAEGAVKVLADYAAALLEHSTDLNDPDGVDRATRIRHVEDVNKTEEAASANPIASAALAATVRKEGT